MKHNNILNNEIYLLKYSDTILTGYVGQSIPGSHDVCISVLIFPDFGHLDIQKLPHVTNQEYGITEYLFSSAKYPTIHCKFLLAMFK
jgi:hypothetical protein